MGCSSCCDSCARTALRDPHAMMLASERASGSIGALLPKVVYPSDVAALKRQIDPSVQTTNAAVLACTALTPAEVASWKLFFLAWTAFRDQPEPWLFGAANLYDEAEVFQAQLAQWQTQLRAKCTIPGPAVVDPHAADDASASVIKWGVGAVVVVSLVYGLRLVLK